MPCSIGGCISFSRPGDNCPAVSNGGQENSDALEAGDDCQCGDVNDDDVADAALIGRVVRGTTTTIENLVIVALIAWIPSSWIESEWGPRE